jgi:hypothetical protein
MKKLFAIAVLGLLLVSCKKSSSPSSSIQATLNDTSSNYSILGYAEEYNGGHTIYMEAYNNTKGATANEIEIRLYSNAPIAPGTYTDTANNSTYPIIYREGYIYVEPNLSPVTGPDEYFETAGLITNPFVITITSISATSIQGTFKGTLYMDGDSSTAPGNYKVITNGRFNSPLALEN